MGCYFIGGEKGIRTLDTVPRIHDFQSCAFDQLSHLSTGCLLDAGNIIHDAIPFCKTEFIRFEPYDLEQAAQHPPRHVRQR